MKYLVGLVIILELALLSICISSNNMDRYIGHLIGMFICVIVVFLIGFIKSRFW